VIGRSEAYSRFCPPGERYFAHLPLRERSALCTLGEGNTPLVRSQGVAGLLGLDELYFKLENANPSGSFKDRIMALQVSLMRQEGRQVCMGPSTGNAGASLAAYAARYGLRCFIFATERADAGKLQQMLFHGARVRRIRGFGESPEYSRRVFDALSDLAARHGAQLVCSAFCYNPDAMEAAKTISFEICEQVDDAGVDHVFVPVAGGGLLSAMWKGFQEFASLGRIASLPRMGGVQSAGCPVVVRAIHNGRAPASLPSTTNIGPLAASFAPDGERAARSIMESGGWGYAPDDDEIFAAQRLLAGREGIFAEPTAAASLAGLIHALQQKRVRPGERVVCVITGHGFKDPDSVAAANGNDAIPMLDLEELADARLNNDGPG
jgi:threonine synthase